MVTDFSTVNALLQNGVGPVFPAAQLVVVDHFSIVLEGAVGDCDADTLFDIASLTKPLCTATLTMMAVEAGALALEDHPRPEMTVAQLLSHASGLPAWKPLYAQAAGPRAIVDAVMREPLEAPPGARAVYSDLGFILLGAWLEQRLGERLDAAFARQIARPLGVGTCFTPAAPTACAPTEGALRGVVHDDNARAFGGVAGHAGLFSTARDVSRLTHALVAAWHGVRSTVPRLLPQARVRQMWTPSLLPGSTFCLGWDRPAAVGSSAGTRWPRDGVGHLGFTGCSLWIDPARARWVVLLSNRVHPRRDNDEIKRLRPRLHDAIVAALDGD